MKIKGRAKMVVFLGCLLIFSGLYGQTGMKAGNLYQEARRFTLNQKWTKALELFQKMLDQYHSAAFSDEVRFWTGYCLEKTEETEIEAFIVFQDLIDLYPNSTWKNDAVMHQIRLSEKIVQKGYLPFLAYLLDRLNDPDPESVNQAALALGRLGYAEARPVLERLKESEMLGSQAKALLAELSAVKTGISAMESLGKFTGGEEYTDVPESDFCGSPYDIVQRYRQYRSMLRTDGNWSKEELIDFGMWTILTGKEFEAYQLPDSTKKQAWMEKYWKLRDPTPTTDENEAEEEFVRRVAFANTYFSRLLDIHSLDGQRDAKLRPNKPHAPWDARGELYIQFGKPDEITNVILYTDRWKYDDEKMDFTLLRHLTNIFGTSIKPGGDSKHYHWPKINTDHFFFLKPGFHYPYRFEGKTFRKLGLSVVDTAYTKTGTFTVVYKIPVNELKTVRQDEMIKIQMDETVVVFDDNCRTVYSQQNQRDFAFKNKKEIKKLRKITGRIPVKVKPGKYRIAIRVEDIRGKKTGIKQTRWEVPILSP